VPQLLDGKSLIDENSLRALVKLLENIPDDKLSQLEMKLGEPYVSEIDKAGKTISKEILSIGSEVAL
jgi:bisphosphoglycerate-dependent phosphoglycerate mutase